MAKINEVAMQLLIDENKALKWKIADLKRCDEINTGCEPSLSCFNRALDELFLLVDDLNNG